MSTPVVTFTNPTPSNIVADILTFVRRIIKTTSTQAMTDQTIGDYVNRFVTYHLPLRLQLFDFKRQYTFETTPNLFMYQFPYKLFQMIKQPCYCDGIQMGFYMSNEQFYNVFPEYVNNEFPIQGSGVNGPYDITLAQGPILRGFVDALGNLLSYVYVSAMDNSGMQQVLQDDGQGNLIQIDENQQIILNPVTNLPITYGTVNYITGTVTATFPTIIPAGNNIETQSSPYSAGRPRILLFFNNIIKLYPVPDRVYKIQADAFITPMQFLTSADSVTFSYMAEYLARGAARLILTDNGDYDQFQFYEPLFREQEAQVLRRSERQNATQRTPTIFSAQMTNNPYTNSQF